MFDFLIDPKAIGEICKDLGQIFFASVFITSLMSDNMNYVVVMLGFILSIMCWSAYIVTRKY